MKKIYSFVLLAVMLLSTNLWAEDNVAKVGETLYTTLDGENGAIAAWQKTGGELQLLGDNATYNATGTVTISTDATLNLNGKTLTWKVNGTKINAITASKAITIKDDTQAGVLSFLFTEMKGSAQYGIYQTAGSCTIENVTLKCDVSLAETSAREFYAVCAEAGDVYIRNSKILLYNNASGGVRINGKNAKTEFSGMRIEHKGKTADDVTITTTTYRGLYFYAANSVTLSDASNYIDMSLAPLKPSATSASQYALYFANGSSSNKGIQYRVSAGIYKVTTEDTWRNGIAIKSATSDKKYTTTTIEGGVFVGKTNISIDYQGTISGGIFNVAPDTKNIPEGYTTVQITDGEYKGYYEVKAKAAESIMSVDGQTYSTEAEGWAKCSTTAGTYTAVTLFPSDNYTAYTIPANVYATLEKDGTQALTITNNGNLKLATGTWNDAFTNNGTFHIEGGSFGDNFVLTNTGTVDVIGGVFTAKAKQQIANYIHTGYVANLQADGTYKVIENTAIVAKVNGLYYTDLVSALKASSATYPAELQKNCSTGTLGTLPARAMFLDMNGKTITLSSTGKNTCGVIIENGSLTIQGTGIIEGSAESLFKLKGTTDASATDYSTLTIGENVTLKQSVADGYGVAVYDANSWYGVTVNFNGAYESEGSSAFYIHGGYTDISDNMPIFNISKDAKITANSLAYAAGYGIWNYAGTATTSHHGFELRAGKLTMNGGSIVCTATEPADDQFNGNGSTSQACAISAMQHDTKLSISVVINGGELKAYTPIYQANPQKNSEEDIKKVSVVVNNTENGVGPKIYSTSNNIVWSANKVVTLNGGVYNLNPAAYAAEGKAVVENTNTDTKAMYPYAIGEKAAAVTTAKAGNWNETAIWEGGVVPTTATPVVIKHAVTIPAGTKAQTYGIEVQGGTITVEGALAIGNGGIKGITDANQLLIKDGGAMVISPAAAKENSQPLAMVYKKLNIRHKAEGEYKEGVESPYLREHIGIPTLEKPQKNISLLYRQWNTVSGWEDATEYGTPFKGYSVTDETTPKEDVSFAGKLVGNQNAILNMPRQGFHFVANSWVAPINTIEVLNQVGKLSNNDATEVALKIFIPETKTINGEKHYGGTFKDINKITLEDEQEAWGKITPMQAFFLFANEPTTITLSYEQAAWNTMLAAKFAAPKRIMGEEENVKVRIRLTAKDGHEDNVTLREGEAFHSTKMMNESPNVNIYVDTEAGNYSTFVTEDLEGTTLKIQTNDQTEYTLSFDRLKGETLAIKDLETGAITTMTAENTYTFKATANTTIRRFVITRKEVPSSVEDITVSGVKGVYTIMGQFLGENVDLNTLPQGIYVIDGQKYIK